MIRTGAMQLKIKRHEITSIPNYINPIELETQLYFQCSSRSKERRIEVRKHQNVTRSSLLVKVYNQSGILLIWAQIKYANKKTGNGRKKKSNLPFQMYRLSWNTQSSRINVSLEVQLTAENL